MLERLPILTEHEIYPFMDSLFCSCVTAFFRKWCNLRTVQLMLCTVIYVKDLRTFGISPLLLKCMCFQ